MPLKEAVSLLSDEGRTRHGTQPLFVHFLSGKTECVSGTAALFLDHGLLVCCSDDGITLKTFHSDEITFATYDSGLTSLNLWI